MKKYKTWELLKMAEEREYGFNKSVGERPKYRDSNGNVVVFDKNAYGKGLFLSNGFPLKLALVNTEWELIQQPVDFLTAVKAYAEGKTIRCESKTGFTYKYKPHTKGDYFVDTSGDAPCIGEIFEGTWYVENSHE